MKDLKYLSGFNNQFVSEALPDVILEGRNSPQKVPYGLYAEQLNASAFSVERAHNLHAWLYRQVPSVSHGEFQPFVQSKFKTPPFETPMPPTQLRWNPLPSSKKNTDFIDGLFTLLGNGQASDMTGAAIHLYHCNRSMTKTRRYFFNADGELLLIPQKGSLLLKTEMGLLKISPDEIAVIPRGVKFQVDLLEKEARGYLLENFGLPFRLPELGVLGANALAHPRDFLYPSAWYENKSGKYSLVEKFQGNLWQAPIDHSPLDVVAWTGNCAPYKYNLNLFNVINTVSFDHPDPSIFTVLQSPSTVSGVSNLDFSIFPPRWMVAENTFRPPYYHRNIMSEYMGLIRGVYDAKAEGFVPGGSSLHNCMSAHGPDKQAYDKAIYAEFKPEYYEGTLAFMLESRFAWNAPSQALDADFRQPDYLKVWQGLENNFNQAAHPSRLFSKKEKRKRAEELPEKEVGRPTHSAKAF